VTSTSATIIDFGAYKAARKRMTSESIQGRPEEQAHDAAPIGLYFFWPILAWMPIGLLLMPGATEDLS
jgi:hypothetical protein